MIFRAYSISFTDDKNRIVKPARKIIALDSFLKESITRPAVAYINMDRVNIWYRPSVLEKNFTGSKSTKAPNTIPISIDSLPIIFENLYAKRE